MVSLGNLVLDILARGGNFAKPNLGQVGKQLIFDEATIICERPFQVTLEFGNSFPHKTFQYLDRLEELDLS